MRFIVLVVVFFGILALLAALMIGIAIKLIAIVAFGIVAICGAIWFAARLRKRGAAPGP